MIAARGSGEREARPFDVGWVAFIVELESSTDVIRRVRERYVREPSAAMPTHITVYARLGRATQLNEAQIREQLRDMRRFRLSSAGIEIAENRRGLYILVNDVPELGKIRCLLEDILGPAAPTAPGAFHITVARHVTATEVREAASILTGEDLRAAELTATCVSLFELATGHWNRVISFHLEWPETVRIAAFRDRPSDGLAGT